MLDTNDLQQIRQLMNEQRDDILKRMDMQRDDILHQVDEKIQAAEERILQQSARNTQVIIENVVDRQFKLVLEALEAQSQQIRQLANNARVDDLEDETRLMKSAIRSNSDRLTALEKKFA